MRTWVLHLASHHVRLVHPLHVLGFRELLLVHPLHVHGFRELLLMGRGLPRRFPVGLRNLQREVSFFEGQVYVLGVLSGVFFFESQVYVLGVLRHASGRNWNQLWA